MNDDAKTNVKNIKYDQSFNMLCIQNRANKYGGFVNKPDDNYLEKSYYSIDLNIYFKGVA